MSRLCKHCGGEMGFDTFNSRHQCYRRNCPAKNRRGVRRFVNYCRSRMGVHPATTRAVMVSWAEFMAEQLSAGYEIYHPNIGVVKATHCKTTFKTVLHGKEYTIGPRMIISFAACRYLKKLTKAKYDERTANTDRSLGATPPANG